MKRAFTLLELMLAVVLVGIMTTISILTFRAVTRGWRVSRDYMDRLERTDYAVDQLVSALRCAYYPHAGSQNGDYGFQLTDNGDGDDPDSSDVIEWTKTGMALVGADSAGDSVHRVQVRVLEEGNDDWGERIEKTGLYLRVRPLSKIIEDDDASSDENDFSFESDEYYRPVLIVKDVEGFNCRVQKEPPSDSGDGKEDKSKYEDEFSESNSLPYKVQLTLYIQKEDPEYASRKIRIPILRTIRLPVHEQSKDGAVLPDEAKDTAKRNGPVRRGGTPAGGGRGGAPAGGGGPK